MEITSCPRVLVVEDDALVAQFIEFLLADGGCEVAAIARDGRAGVQAVIDVHPDVVVMDIEMPGMDGIEATRRIQELCPTPVVILTGYDSPELVARAATAGAHAYVTKPPRRLDLVRAILFAQATFRADC
jgi:two-component system, response regulator PdtaR